MKKHEFQEELNHVVHKALAYMDTLDVLEKLYDEMNLVIQMLKAERPKKHEK